MLELISIHIGKTAGTTFRGVLSQVYQEQNVLWDYAPYPYHPPAPLPQNIRAIHGHIPAQKYDGYFPEAKRIVWLREPVSRLISEYYFARKYKDIYNSLHRKLIEKDLSFAEFAEQSEAQNIMSKQIAGLALEDFYFVGLQEFYEADLLALEHLMGWKNHALTFRNKNPDPEYELRKSKILENKELVEHLKKINSADMEMYQKALKLKGVRLNKNAKMFDYSQEIPNSEKNVDLLKQKASQYREQGDWTRALECYEIIESKYNVQDWKNYNLMGDALINLSQWKEASIAYRKSLDLNPHSPWSWHNLAVAFRHLEKWNDVENCHEELKKINPNFWEQNQNIPLVRDHRVKTNRYEIGLTRKGSEFVQKSISEENGAKPVLPVDTDRSAQDYSMCAALTIVSKNYLPAARVLCDSYLQHHPNSSFFVVLTDRIDGYFVPEEEKFHLLTVEDIDLPSKETLFYQYTILELNTAVKPFSLRFIFDRYDFDKLLYIDPDIQVFGSLTKIWDSLEDNHVALTPHMRKPFNDSSSPSEVEILQSGTYNLGFIGLRKSNDAFQLLNWWMEKLYLNCVIDIPRGLFTDQKWMDLVPAYFEKTAIIYNPAYNIAYWNLHERVVSKFGDEYFVDEEPLKFFHFSGYNPLSRDTLSKHQSRHNLLDLKEVRELCHQYGDSLLSFGYSECKKWPYAYGVLSNGVEATSVINWIVRKCVVDGVPFPSPTLEPEEFCIFIMSTDPRFGVGNVCPLVKSILYHRPDVQKAFPGAANDSNDKGFINWLINHGSNELRIQALVENYLCYLGRKNPVESITDQYLKREDLKHAFAGFWQNDRGYSKFEEWLYSSGRNEMGISLCEADRFVRAKSGFLKILHFFFSRSDLQKVFLKIHLSDTIGDFVFWLKEHLSELPNISCDEVYWFEFVANQKTDDLLFSNISYNSWIRKLVGAEANIFDIDKICSTIDADSLIRQKLIEWLSKCVDFSPMVQISAHYWNSKILQHLYPDALSSIESLKKLVRHISQENNLSGVLANGRWETAALSQELDEFNQTNCAVHAVTVSGYFGATTGMGELGRAISKIVRDSNLKLSQFELPNPFCSSEILSVENCRKLFGWYDPLASVSITVANADAVPSLITILPNSYWLRGKNIGYWVWETEQLPYRFCESADPFEEIWTMSEYSANAIRACVDKPVKVLPPVLDFDEIDTVNGHRDEFNLPEDKIIFGYFFDSKSVLERKNPKAVIQAFMEAFGDSNEALLVLKVNSPLPREYEYELLKAGAKSPKIIWIEGTFEREKVLRLMDCLDVYISLHRSEGFGLTMAEAMALGKPVIASGYSGNVDFMDSSNSCLVRTKPVRTRVNHGPYPPGTVWGEPDIEEAASYMKILYEDEQMRNEFGRSAYMDIRNKLSPSVVVNQLYSLLSNEL